MEMKLPIRKFFKLAIFLSTAIGLIILGPVYVTGFTIAEVLASEKISTIIKPASFSPMAMALLGAAEDNYKFSQQVYDLKKKQYSAGIFSYEKLINTERTLSSSEQDYITAVYDLLRSKINYQKATGNY